jgi:hypothetical protein
MTTGHVFVREPFESDLLQLLTGREGEGGGGCSVVIGSNIPKENITIPGRRQSKNLPS